MTQNPLEDGKTYSVALLNSIATANEVTGVLSGCTISTGVGDWDVDVSTGEIVYAGSRQAVSSQTVTVSSSNTDDRVDLITVDSNGNASSVTGTPDPTPNAPDIPTGEVLVGLVYVRGGSTAVEPGDIREEYQTVLQEVTPEMLDPQGEGSGLDADTLRNRSDYYHPDNDGEGSGLDADLLRGDYPLPNSALTNDSVTINTGNQLSGGGSIALGGSRTIGVEDGPGSGLDADTWQTLKPDDKADNNHDNSQHSEEYTAVDRFNTEEGNFSFNNSSTPVTTTVNLSETYVAAAAGVSIEFSMPEGSDTIFAHFDGWNTDSNGNYVSFDIRHLDQTGDGQRAHWNVGGLTI